VDPQNVVTNFSKKNAASNVQHLSVTQEYKKLLQKCSTAILSYFLTYPLTHLPPAIDIVISTCHCHDCHTKVVTKEDKVINIKVLTLL